MRTKKGEKEKLRIVILDKAVSYFKKHGQGSAAAERVMESAGLTKGALYSHFKSKDDLFAAAICHDLEKLEADIQEIMLSEGRNALKILIESHLSEENLHNVEDSCVFTSLSTDMQRSKAAHRALYETIIIRIYQQFTDAFAELYPKDPISINRARAFNLYSGLVGTLSMARTMKDTKRAHEILETGKTFLIHSLLKN